MTEKVFFLAFMNRWSAAAPTPTRITRTGSEFRRRKDASTGDMPEVGDPEVAFEPRGPRVQIPLPILFHECQTFQFVWCFREKAFFPKPCTSLSDGIHG